ncbi:hypothetical protein PsYK624_107950 [Phanerochaete sordida]|uniref:HotDog ACOT-type domain-containing protein n=1 Tax=Phanerochaete sordida TaxID=48140 RepID=A0A9P3GJC4_9APHY|nr:hypothetical protein PsYK624_107950 [Phanerochaete sordida]
MDALLRVVCDRVDHAQHCVLPMKSGPSWSESLRWHGTRRAHAAEHGGLVLQAAAALRGRSLGAVRGVHEWRDPHGKARGLSRLARGQHQAQAHAPSVERIAAPAALGFYLVTASLSMDRLDMLVCMSPEHDLRLSGQVVYVGRSSMEVAVRMEALNSDGSEETVMLGRLCTVCSDSKAHKAHPVNPIVIETVEDQQLWHMGEAHKNRRTNSAVESLACVLRWSSESAVLHSLYLQSVVQWTPRVERNIHSKIFGGCLMRLAYELGYSYSMFFTRGPVRFLSLDSISFAPSAHRLDAAPQVEAVQPARIVLVV